MSRYVSIVLVVMLSAAVASAKPTTAAEKLQRAQIAIQQQDYQQAEQLLRDAIKQDKKSIEAHAMYADLLNRTKRYSQAAQEYKRVLELDADQKQLSDQNRREIIDSEAVSFALSGDLQHAKTIYLSVLQQDPDYAMYNYNLACVYAELHDLDTALPYLKKAWDKRDTLPQGMQFPDPRKDDSFRPYVDDPKFQNAVKNMVQ